MMSFDCIPEMNEILNVFHQRIFNLEIAISNRSHTTMDHNLLSPKTNIIVSRELDSNSMGGSLQRSMRNSVISNRHSPDSVLEKQLHKLNLSGYTSFEQTTEDNNSLHSGQSKHISPNQMKTRAYEFFAIFEDAFDQLNIIHNVFPMNNINSSVFISDNSNCNPHTLNLAGIFPMNEIDKFRYEIKHFFQILILLFRALLLDSKKDFSISLNHTYNRFPSKELLELNNRLKNSQDKLISLKKQFPTENSDELKFQLKDRLMEEQYRSKVALRYSHDWKMNHIFQWIQMLLQIENDYNKTFHQYENILRETDKIHQEKIQYLIKQNDEMKFNANKWYEYYQDKTSHFEKELIDFRYEFNQIKKQRKNMYEEYQKMKRIIEEYNQIKFNENILLQRQKQKEEAIKHIQAWWRGIISRQKKRRKKIKSR